MATWMQNGMKDPMWVSHPECKTALKSSLYVVTPDGKETRPQTINQDATLTVPTWGNVDSIKELHYEVQTLSDGKGANDRINLELQMFDLVYVAQVTDEAMNELTDEQIALAVDDVNAFTEALMPLIEAKLDPTLTIKTIWSSIPETPADGILKGTIPWPSQWPPGQYTFLAHYGYSHEMEKADSAKAVDFWVYEMLPLVIEITAAVLAGFFTGGASLVLTAAAIAAASFDIARIGTEYYRNAFGMVGENIHGCAFPYGGWVQSYAIGHALEDEAAELEGAISLQNGELIGAVDNYIATQGLMRAVFSGSIIFGLLLVLFARKRGKKKSRNGGENDG